MKEPKVIFSADKYDLVKTHFAAAIQTKEQRDAKEPSLFIGEGITTVWKNSTAKPVEVSNDDDFDF